MPAVLMTSATSGSILNLRPDRLFSVAKADVASYLGLIFVGSMSFFIFFIGLIGSSVWLISLMGTSVAPLWARPFVSYPVLCLGIYFLHLFGWQSGLYYRGYHEAFNWLFQRHIRTNNAEKVAVQDARRKVRKYNEETAKEVRNVARRFGDPW
jgi:hypothetical protein